MSYNKLYYNRVELTYDGTTIRVGPNFRCPVCGGRPEELMNRTWNCSVNRALDVNQPVTYAMSCCHTEIALHLAVYKAKGSLPIYICISTTPIPDGWWQPPPL